jgi:hypothetical protein
MDLLTWLLIIFGFGFAICLLQLIKMIGDLSQVSVHESPAILETPNKTASGEESCEKATASHESSPTELGGAQ